jgi:hypothetical protein
MRANPDPQKIVAVLSRQRSVVKAHTDRPKLSNFSSNEGRDDADHYKAFRSRDPLIAEPPPAVVDRRPKTVESHGASSVRAPSLFTILARFRDQPIKSAGRHIRFQLTIPFVSIELGIPGAKRSTLFRRQATYSILNFFDRAHICSIRLNSTQSNIAVDPRQSPYGRR